MPAAEPVASVRPVDSLSTLILLVQGQGRGDGFQGRSGALAPQQLGLVPCVGGELDLHAPPCVGEEGLVAVLQETPDPYAYGGGVGQQLPGEVQLPRPPGGRHLDRAGPCPRVGERGGGAGVVQTRTGEFQGGRDEPFVVQPVQDVQVLGERRAGPAVPAVDTGERHEDVGEGVPPQELGLVQPVREVRLQGGGGRGRPAVQAGVVSRLGEGVEREPQLGEGGGLENYALGRQARDVDVHAHPSMVRGARADQGVT